MSGIDIDALYESFCNQVPASMREVAFRLAFTLRLVPSADIPWSAAFKNVVTLQAPWLCVDPVSDALADSVERAVLAHMLAIIEAFGTDRIADEQVTDTPELRNVLALMREARDEALKGLGGSDAVRIAREADEQTRTAIAREREMLLRGDPVSLDKYEHVSAGKQAVGLPGSLALAAAVDWSAERKATLRSTLLGVWLGLQFQDDVVDWEDDATRGGAWAVVLAHHRVGTSARGVENREALRRVVHSSGVLADMLGLALEQYRAALSGAERLGAERLAAWLRERVAEVAEYHEKEHTHPGYLWRLKKLAPWSAEVLA